MADEERNEDLDDLEAALASLSPRGSRIDRDRLLFLAGRASAEPTSGSSVRRRWLWPAATAASLTAACVLGALLAVRPETPVRRQIVYIEQPKNTIGKQDPETRRERPMSVEADKHVVSPRAVSVTDSIWVVADGRQPN